MVMGNRAITPPSGIRIDAALSECERELGVRVRCYKRWVQDGKLTQFEASERANRLEAACHYLRELSRMENMKPELEKETTPPRNIIPVEQTFDNELDTPPVAYAS